MKRVQSALALIDAMNEWVGKIFSFIVIAIMLVAFMEVMLRYVFSRPTTWAWEVNVQLLALITFFGAGYTLLYNRHVKLDMLILRLSPRRRALVDLITGLFFFFACGLIIYEGVKAAWHSVSIREHLYTVFAPPIYPLKCLLPIGVSLLLLQGIAKFIRDLMIFTQSEGGK